MKNHGKRKTRAGKRKREDISTLETDEARPKQMRKTLDNTRVKDETILHEIDEEVMQDEANDEYKSYFAGESTPKILFTTCNKPKSHETMLFIEELAQVIPNANFRYRKGIDLKMIIPEAIKKGFTDLVVVNEDHKKANGILVAHLPEGPTLHFKLTSIQRVRHIKNHGRLSQHRPEVIMNNFSTRLGHTVGRSLAALFPYDPQFTGRRVVTFHNQRDFIFFRHHRYVFKNSKKTGLQELGPRFTLKLRSIQKGTFNSKYGEYEWIHKRKEMDTSRRKFHL